MFDLLSASLRPVSHTNHPHARDINTALIKLYSESTSDDRMDKISQLLAEVTIDQVSESDANLDYIGENELGSKHSFKRRGCR